MAEAIGAHAGHALDGAVTSLALDAGADVGLVGEVSWAPMITWQPMQRWTDGRPAARAATRVQDADDDEQHQ